MPKQVTHLWKYFDDNIPQKRESLQNVIDTLIDSGYHIDNVIPVANYQKQGGSTILITEAIILVSEVEENTKGDIEFK